jgi:hypothetical protein
MKLATIALIFYVISCGIACSEQQQQLVYHPWLIDNDGNYDPAYFSGVNGRWMCDANQGRPVNERGPTRTCDGSGLRGPDRIPTGYALRRHWRLHRWSLTLTN